MTDQIDLTPLIQEMGLPEGTTVRKAHTPFAMLPNGWSVGWVLIQLLTSQEWRVSLYPPQCDVIGGHVRVTESRDAAMAVVTLAWFASELLAESPPESWDDDEPESQSYPSCGGSAVSLADKWDGNEEESSESVARSVSGTILASREPIDAVVRTLDRYKYTGTWRHIFRNYDYRVNWHVGLVSVDMPESRWKLDIECADDGYAIHAFDTQKDGCREPGGEVEFASAEDAVLAVGTFLQLLVQAREMFHTPCGLLPVYGGYKELSQSCHDSIASELASLATPNKHKLSRIPEFVGVPPQTRLYWRGDWHLEVREGEMADLPKYYKCYEIYVHCTGAGKREPRGCPIIVTHQRDAAVALSTLAQWLSGLTKRWL